MLALGSELYRLTQRDEETLLIEPYFRQRSLTLPGGVLNGSVRHDDVPKDRCLYIINWNIEASPGAGQVANIVRLTVTNQDNTVGQWLWEVRGSLTGENNAGSVGGSGVAWNWGAGCILPPGVVPSLYYQKGVSDVQQAVVLSTIAGYLIPPGRIGRVF